jgi:hypothetical protein
MAKQQATGNTNTLAHSLQTGLWTELVEKRLASPLEDIMGKLRNWAGTEALDDDVTLLLIEAT